MSIDLAVWKWADGTPLPDPKVLHEKLDRQETDAAMTRFDPADFEAGLKDMHALAGEPGGPWSYEACDPGEGRANWIRLSVGIGVIQLFAPRLVTLAVVNGLVVSDPHNDHIIGA